MDTPEFLPKYTHDCTRCVYVGRYWDRLDRDDDGNPVEQDVYLCTDEGRGRSPSLIRRYGNEGHEYHCMDLIHYAQNYTLMELCLPYVSFALRNPIDVAHSQAIWEEDQRSNYRDEEI